MTLYLNGSKSGQLFPDMASLMVFVIHNIMQLGAGNNEIRNKTS